MRDERWFCPAKEEEIVWGLCWEYCFAELGGPTDTELALKKWIEHSEKFNNVEEFHMVCEQCVHCQWSR